MKTNDHVRVLVALACLGASACNQADPMTTDGSTSDATQGSGGPVEGDYYPLRDGASWTYRHVATDGTTWDEVVQMRQTTFNGGEAFEIEDNEDSDSENTISTLVRDEGQVLRVHKEVFLAGAVSSTVDYDPGFLRYDHGWVEGDAIDWMYDRTEYDETGAVDNESVRHQIFTIESTSSSITVPAGTFDCVQFTRLRPDTGDATRFWFSEGVGKVKSESLDSGSVEELAEYTIP